MVQPGFSYQPGALPQHGTAPTAPPLLGPPEDHDLPPPSYAEAISAPGGSFNSLSALRQPEASRGVPWQPPHSGAPVIFTNIEAALASAADAEGATPTRPAADGTGDDPPSYQSLYGQIKDAKKSSSGACDFLSKLLLMPMGCLVGLGVMLVLVGLVFGLPLTLIIVGSLYIGDCPVEPGIPIWMVVGGVVLSLITLKELCNNDDVSTSMTIFTCLFYVAWYIAGAVLIYPTWQPAFHPEYFGDTRYCDYTVMMTAFVIINLMSIFTALTCCTGSL